MWNDKPKMTGTQNILSRNYLFIALLMYLDKKLSLILTYIVSKLEANSKLKYQ